MRRTPDAQGDAADGRLGPRRRAAARRRPRVSTALSEINVVPLVDVMLVLLIIFMVAAPMMQQGLSVNLPQQRRVAGHAAEERADLRHGAGGASARNRSCSSATSRCASTCWASGSASASSRATTSKCSCAATASDDAAGDGRDGSPEGRRRREGRHGLAARSARPCRWRPTMAMTSRPRLQHHRRARARAGRPAQDDDRVGGAHVGAIVAIVVGAVAGRRARTGRRDVMTISLGGAPGPRHRRHDVDHRPRRAAGRAQAGSAEARRPSGRPRRRRRRWSSRSPSRRRRSRTAPTPRRDAPGRDAHDRRGSAGQARRASRPERRRHEARPVDRRRWHRRSDQRSSTSADPAVPRADGRR